MTRFPSKLNTLQILKDFNVPIGTILDVGAHAETIELRRAFPDKRHILFEPASEFHDALRTNYAGMDHEVVPMALCDNDGQGHLHKRSIDGATVTHSSLTAPREDLKTEIVPTARLDTFLKSRDEKKPYFLKIDVDGFEIPILRGAEGILLDVSVIVVEAPVDTIAERLNYVLSKGFRIFDIIDQCYYYDVMSQVDLVFLSAKVMEDPNFHPWTTKPFVAKQWVPIASFEGSIPKS
jgi:FkbM family methyltransferase